MRALSECNSSSSPPFPHYSQLIIPKQPKNRTTPAKHSQAQSTILLLQQRTGYLLPHATKSFTRLRSSGSGFTFQNVARAPGREDQVCGDRRFKSWQASHSARSPLGLSLHHTETTTYIQNTNAARSAYTLPIRILPYGAEADDVHVRFKFSVATAQPSRLQPFSLARCCSFGGHRHRFEIQLKVTTRYDAICATNKGNDCFRLTCRDHYYM